jgi:hypothetical protein
MATTVFLENGDRLTLDNRSVIGSGGEGSVFHHPQDSRSVIKIYENPTIEREKKLRAFVGKRFSLPGEIALPQSLILDNHQNVIGFVMPFYKKAKAVKELSNRKFRATQKISNRQIVDINLHEASLLDQVHTQGLVVGDLNDQNVFFLDNTSYFIDVDSWQFDTWPCPVATESFLDPGLYGLDLSRRPVFVPNHDWYSYDVMLFRDLLLVHPYGGTHPKVDELTKRAIQKITIFDKDVIYPAIGLPPDLLTDDLLQTFNRIFKNGWRGPFPQDTLKGYRSSLISCPACQTEYPSSRRTCPVCQEQNQATISISLPGSITLKLLQTIKGNILSSKFEGNDLLIITLDNGWVYLNLANINRAVTIPLFPFQTGMHIEASSKIVVSNLAGSEELSVFEIDHGQVKAVEGGLTDIYTSTQNAIFRVVGNHLYRLVGSQLIDSEVKNGRLLNRSLRTAIEHQTWFTAGSDPEPILVGFNRVLRQQFFWLCRPGYFADLTVPQLEPGESLTDLTVKTSGNTVLIIRKTIINGVVSIRFDLFDKQGKCLSSTKVETKHLPSDNIHGLAFAGGKIIFPIDTGAVLYDPLTNISHHFTATNKVVNSSQALFAYQAGLLVLSPTNLSYLTQN